jgi:hypothetical protein
MRRSASVDVIYGQPLGAATARALRAVVSKNPDLLPPDTISALYARTFGVSGTPSPGVRFTIPVRSPVGSSGVTLAVGMRRPPPPGLLPAPGALAFEVRSVPPGISGITAGLALRFASVRAARITMELVQRLDLTALSAALGQSRFGHAGPPVRLRRPPVVSATRGRLLRASLPLARATKRASWPGKPRAGTDRVAPARGRGCTCEAAVPG